MDRPFAVIGFSAFGALTLGACLGSYLPPGLCWVCLAAGLVALLAVICFYKRKLSTLSGSGVFRISAIISLSLLAAGACLFLYGSAAGEAAELTAALDGKKVQVQAQVLDFPEESWHKWYYLIRVRQASVEGEALDLPEFTARLSAWQPFACEPGDTVECEAGFYAFSGDGLYSSRNSYWADGVSLGGYLAGSGARVVPGAGLDFSSLLAYWRREIGRVFQRNLPEREAGLIRAILLGEKSGLENGDYGNFQKTGISHLVVVSGLHLSILSAFLSRLMARTKLKKWIKNLTVSLLLFGFLCLIGVPSSAMRSWLMLSLYLTADSLGQRTDGVNSLGFAVLVICLFRPFSGGDLGFALSVFSTLGILLWAGSWRKGPLRAFRRCPRLKKDLAPAAASLKLTCSAVSATLPIQLAVFGGIPILAPLANLLLVFPCTLLLHVSAIGAFLGLVPLPGLEKPFVFCGGWLAEGVLWGAEKLAGIPAAYLNLERPQCLLVLCMIFLLAGAAFLLGRKGKAAALAAVLCLCFTGWTGLSENQVTFAAAGGSSCVAVMRNGKASILGLGGFRTGAAVSILTKGNIGKVEVLCLPVWDWDAREAAAQVLDAYPVELLVLPSSAKGSAELLPVSKEVKTVFAGDGDRFTVLDGVTAEILGDMDRITVTVGETAVAVETRPSGEGECELLFTAVEDSKINCPFTVLQSDAIIEADKDQEEASLLDELPPGRWILAGDEGVWAEISP